MNELKNRIEKRDTVKLLTLLLLAISGFFNFYFLLKQQDIQTKIEFKTDTLTITKTDTVPQYITKTITKPVPFKETIIRHDTLYNAPLSLKTYEDSITTTNDAKVQYRAIISGYEQSLDTIEFNVKYPMITNTVTNTITNEKTITKYKNPKITAGIAAGAGLPGFAYLGIGILVIGYIASLVVWLVFMVKPSNEGANKFGEPAEIKELSSFSIKAE